MGRNVQSRPFGKASPVWENIVLSKKSKIVGVFKDLQLWALKSYGTYHGRFQIDEGAYQGKEILAHGSIRENWYFAKKDVDALPVIESATKGKRVILYGGLGRPRNGDITAGPIFEADGIEEAPVN